MESGEKQHHFVLVHGVCHGAWCWYKVATILESAGHRVTALDMTACGASAACIEEVRSFEEYSRPLLDAVAALTPGEKAVLVGHSFGGQSLALAMERYPEKVTVAVFVTATMPAGGKPMAAYAFKQVRCRKGQPQEERVQKQLGGQQTSSTADSNIREASRRLTFSLSKASTDA